MPREYGDQAQGGITIQGNANILVMDDEKLRQLQETRRKMIDGQKSEVGYPPGGHGTNTKGAGGGGGTAQIGKGAHSRHSYYSPAYTPAIPAGSYEERPLGFATASRNGRYHNQGQGGTCGQPGSSTSIRLIAPCGTI
jgi:hypothetical protein